MTERRSNHPTATRAVFRGTDNAQPPSHVPEIRGEDF